MPHHHHHQGGQPDQVECPGHGTCYCAGGGTYREADYPSSIHCIGASRAVHIKNLLAETRMPTAVLSTAAINKQKYEVQQLAFVRNTEELLISYIISRWQVARGKQ